MPIMYLYDGFETGAISNDWTVITDEGYDGSISSEQAYAGNYSYKVVLNDVDITHLTKVIGGSDSIYCAFQYYVDPSDWDPGSDAEVYSALGGLVILKLTESNGILVGDLTMFSETKSAPIIITNGWHQIKVQARRYGESWVEVIPPDSTHQQGVRWFYTKDAGPGYSQVLGCAVGESNTPSTVVNSTVYFDNIEIWDTYPGPTDQSQSTGGTSDGDPACQ